MTAFPKSDRYAKRARIDYSESALPKHVSRPNPTLRAFAKGLGCQIRKHSPKKHPRCTPVVSGRVVIDAIHVPTGGHRAMSKKASDLGHVFGACHDVHMEQHAIGWPAFQEKYEIDARAIAQDVADQFERRFGKERESDK
jgi:hypothetical protein